MKTAIEVLRDAGYLEEGLYLANKHGEHDWYLRIQVDDLRNYDAALQYIRGLSFIEAERNLQLYCRSLVCNRPDETTELLKVFCTVYTTATSDRDEKVRLRGNPADYIPFYVHFGRHLKALLRYVVADDPKCGEERGSGAAAGDSLALDGVHETGSANRTIWNTLLELCLREDIALAELEAEPGKGDGGGLGGAGAGAGGSSKAGPTAAALEHKRDREVLEDILENPSANYDLDHALVLVEMYRYRPGQLFLFEKLHMYPMVVQHYLELAGVYKAEGRTADAKNARRTVVKKCKALGDKDPTIWIQVLTSFAKEYTGSIDDEDSIKDVLRHIDEESLLPPLLVIQIVASNPLAPLRLVHDFILKRLGSEADQIEEDSRAIKQFREETERNRDKITSLKTTAQVFQSRKCDLCNGDLDPPAIYFMCKHSFHQHCIADNENECRNCAPNHRLVREIQDSLNDKSAQHETFFQELKGASDGFAKVAEYFGKGAFARK